MKNTQARLLGVIFVILISLLSAFSNPGKKPGLAPPAVSVHGQGTMIAYDTVRHFAFHAQKDANGKVSGSGELTYVKGGTKIKFEINCLKVSGKTATMSGIIKKNNRNAPEGTPFWFRAEDNGEGKNATKDRLTLFEWYYNTACTGNTGLAMFNITGGNIQVKP